MSWRRSRHRAENEDEVCGGSRKWSCRETTARLWFQLMAEEKTGDGIGKQRHGREGGGLVSSINSFLNYYLANRFHIAGHPCVKIQGVLRNALQRLQTMQIKVNTSLLILSGFAFSGDDGEMVMKTAVAKSRCGGDDVKTKST
uniref:Uncharacterized protein n=1 Tax=Brassica oleracea TaxID=3712 RepID=A0A3P6BVW0_BRAOL|nr:unnamed protein product [Brassica oleracea]